MSAGRDLLIIESMVELDSLYEVRLYLSGDDEDASWSKLTPLNSLLEPLETVKDSVVERLRDHASIYGGSVIERRAMTPELDPHDRPGRRMIGGALAFHRAASLLLEHDPKALAWATMFVNLGFAIELGLKAYLREMGMSEEGQIALRHDLVKAFNKALEAGFQPPHAAVEALIVELNPHHKDMSLRYLTGTSIDLPEIAQAIVVVGWLLKALHEQGPFRRVG